MSTIAWVQTSSLQVPLRKPFVTAVRRATHHDAFLVSVTDTDGRIGWGEAALSWKVTGESAASAQAAVLGPIADAVTGLPVADHEAWGQAIATSVAHNTAAKAAVDAALWDLASQAEGVPLHLLLDPRSPGETQTDMTISAGEEKAVLADATEHIAAGFGTLKVKLGVYAERDDHVLRALRSGPAAGVRLRVDANQGWTAQEAIRLIHGWEDDGLDVEFIEQPTPAADIDALAAVTAAVSTPVLADESFWGMRDLREILRRNAATAVNIKLAKCGGVTAARALLAEARAGGTDVLIGSMMECVVGISAAAHLAAGVPGVVHDLDAGLWQREAPVAGGVRYDADRVLLGSAPGLGIAALRAEASDER